MEDFDNLSRKADKRDDRPLTPGQQNILNQLEAAARTTHERGVARPDHAPARQETQGSDSVGDDVPCEKCGSALDTGLECTGCGHDMAPLLTGIVARRAKATALAGPMAEQFEVHHGAGTWTDPAYRQDAATWALAWRTAQAHAAPAQQQGAESVAENIFKWWKPERCPITRKPFFMWITHPVDGWVPTYGGPLDSYTIPVMEGEASQPFHERELVRHRYDHDVGDWVEDEYIPLRVAHEEHIEFATPQASTATAKAGAQEGLTDERVIQLWDAQRKYHGGEPCRVSHLEFARAIESALLGTSGEPANG